MIKKNKLKTAPLSYWEECSYMMAIPKCEEETYLKEKIKNFSSTKELEVKNSHYNHQGFFEADIFYQEKEYKIGFYLGGVSVPEYYLQHDLFFQKEEKEALLKATKALTIFMKFQGNPLECYHLQLKIALTFFDDLIGILDESAERMLPARWVKLATSSRILPSAKDLFNIHAVQGKKNKVWLHTHGLLRCGITELEILESDQDNYRSHYNLLNTYAMFLLEKGKEFNPEEEIAYIGRLINGAPVVVVCRIWTEGILEYKKLELGGIKDREKGHNSQTSIIFLYLTEEDEKNKKLSKISMYNDLWKDNPIFYFSDNETNRMKNLAQERFSYVKTYFMKKETQILIKIGLPLKQKGKFEYIWFELLEIQEDKYKARLTQEPYDIENIHVNDEKWFTVKDVADWIIYTNGFAVNPSNVYLLEKE